MEIKAIRMFDGGFMNQHCPEGYENLEMKRIMKL